MFREDLIVGKAGERVALDYVRVFLPDAEIVDGYEPKGDIFIPPDKWIEVKADLRSNETGKLVVETHFQGRMSGLKTTESYRWIFYTGTHLIVTSPQLIKEVIQKGRYVPARLHFEETDINRLGYFLNKKDIEETAIAIQPLNKEGLYDIKTKT